MSKAKILSNLQGRVNFVSDFCATSGLDNGMSDLTDLVREGLVETQRFPMGQDKFGRNLPQVTMYRAYPNTSGLKLV